MTAMGRGWATRWFRPGDEGRVLELLRAAFGEWPRVTIDVPPLEHLRWKMSSDPDARRHSTVAETDGGQIVGLQTIFVQPVLVRNKRARLIQGVDLCVHPEFQGQGVMADMRRFAWPAFGRAFDMRLGQTGREALDKLRRREGSKRVGNTVEVLSADLSSYGAHPTSLDVRQPQQIDERVGCLVAKASQGFEFMLTRSKTYLEWRYDYRAGRYTWSTVEDNGAVLGYSVTRVSGGRGYIADLLALPDRLDVVDALVGDALERFASRGIARVECWSPARHPYRTVLDSHGFMHRRDVLMTYGAFGSLDLSFLRGPDTAVHYSAGDLDLV